MNPRQIHFEVRFASCSFYLISLPNPRCCDGVESLLEDAVCCARVFTVLLPLPLQCHGDVCCGLHHRTPHIVVHDVWNIVEHFLLRLERGRHDLFRPKVLWLTSCVLLGCPDVRPGTPARVGVLSQGLYAQHDQGSCLHDISFIVVKSGCSKVTQYVPLASTEIPDQRHGQGSSHLVRLKLSLTAHDRILDGKQQSQVQPVHR